MYLHIYIYMYMHIYIYMYRTIYILKCVYINTYIYKYIDSIIPASCRMEEKLSITLLMAIPFSSKTVNVKLHLNIRLST